MKESKRKHVPAPFNKWITITGWKKIPAKDRKMMTDLTRLQNRLRKRYKDHNPEPYVNMNAEIEYERHMGFR
jgi:hypothetical protein